MQSIWLPAIRAQLSLNRKNPAEALNHLQAALPPIKYGQIAFQTNLSCLYTAYIRGEANLAAGQGTAAAAEFQKILDHSDGLDLLDGCSCAPRSRACQYARSQDIARS